MLSCGTECPRPRTGGQVGHWYSGIPLKIQIPFSQTKFWQELVLCFCNRPRQAFTKHLLIFFYFCCPSCCALLSNDSIETLSEILLPSLCDLPPSVQILGLVAPGLGFAFSGACSNLL